jgi:hypothetical protein
MPILMSDVSEGSKAVENMSLSSTRMDRAKAETSSAQSDAIIKGLRAQGQQKYMDAEAKMPGVSSSPFTSEGASSSGKETTGSLMLASELQQRKQDLHQEESNLRMLAPEDRVHAEQTLQKKQKDIDLLESKVSGLAQKHLGENYALLDTVKDESSLQGARSYLTQKANAMADEAIANAKITPENREAFVQAQVDALLPKSYDAAGKTAVETRKMSQLDIADQAKYKDLVRKDKAETERFRNDNLRHEADMKKADRDMVRFTATEHRDDLKVLQGTYKDSRAANDKEISLLRELIKQDETAPPKAKVGFSVFGIGTEKENPEFTLSKTMQESRRSQITKYEEQNREILSNQTILAKRLAGDSPKAESRKSSVTIEKKFSEDHTMSGNKLGKKTAKGQEVLDSSGKLIGYYE